MEKYSAHKVLKGPFSVQFKCNISVAFIEIKNGIPNLMLL